MKQLLLIFLCTGFLFSSCSDHVFFEENYSIDSQSWSWDDQVSFQVDVTDTLNPYNFFLNLRVTRSYEYKNIYVFFNTEFPDGRTSKDTVEYYLTDEFGNWVGDVSGSLVNNKVLFKPKRIFPVSGRYKFSFEQAMREKSLAEVTDIGLRIEKAAK